MYSYFTYKYYSYNETQKKLLTYNVLKNSQLPCDWSMQTTSARA